VLGPRRVGDRDAARRFNEARWSLLKAPERLNDEQAATLRQLRRAGGEVWRAYTLKEALRAIFQPGLTIEDVTVLIDRFISKALRSRLAPFVRLAQTIRKHRDGILQAIRLGINQGRTEALNNKVRLITRRAYGFHSAQAALALMMLTCGPITLQPPHELHLSAQRAGNRPWRRPCSVRRGTLSERSWSAWPG
jgi:transposase